MMRLTYNGVNSVERIMIIEGELPEGMNLYSSPGPLDQTQTLLNLSKGTVQTGTGSTTLIATMPATSEYTEGKARWIINNATVGTPTRINRRYRVTDERHIVLID